MKKYKKFLSVFVFTLVLAIASVSVYAKVAKNHKDDVKLGYGCEVDCYIQADGGSGFSTTTARVSNSNYRAKAYLEACIGSTNRIATCPWQTNNGGVNYVKASIGSAYNATEYHSSHTCSGPASITGMMVRLNQ